MSADENTAAVRRLHAFTTTGDLAALTDLFAPTFVCHDPNQPTVHTRDDRTRATTELRYAFPDFHQQPHDVIAAGDQVVERWTFRGTHMRTGKQVSITGITIYRFADGKIVEQWDAYDQLGLLRQRGLFPATEQTREAGA